jgi:hypothetical protein
MEYTALWGSKGFIVSPSKIVPLMNLATTFALKSDSGNDTSGTATTNTRGRELQSVSLSTRYVRAAGVDPRGQLAEWHALVGKANPLYIGGQRFGPPKLMLKSVDVSNVLMDNQGKFLQADVALKFEEYTDTTAAVSSGNTSAQKAAATYNAITEQKKNAMKAGATSADKAARKPVRI